MRRNPFKPQRVYTSPLAWLGFAILGTGTLMASAMMYVVTHVAFR
jgi:hypothetical protein